MNKKQFNVTVSALIRHEREAARITQKQLVARLKWPKWGQATLSRIESGTRNISFHLACELSRALRIPLACLVPPTLPADSQQ